MGEQIIDTVTGASFIFQLLVKIFMVVKYPVQSTDVFFGCQASSSLLGPSSRSVWKKEWLYGFSESMPMPPLCDTQMTHFLKIMTTELQGKLKTALIYYIWDQS